MQENVNSFEELQRLLNDERDRCNLHKQNYGEIKDEYTKLQSELATILEQLAETRSRNELMQTSHRSEVYRLEKRIREQEQEIQSLVEKNQSIDLVKIREAVLEEATSHYESKIKELNYEIDTLRDQYNNLHYESTVLKCNFGTRETEFSCNLENIQLEHLAEVGKLEEKINNLLKEKSQTPDASYAVELKSAKRDILELRQKNKVFLSECEDLRAQNENLSLQISALTRANAKQAADNVNNLRTLESEKIKVSRELELCKKELCNVQEHRKALNAEFESCRQELLSLQAKFEENEHSSRMSLVNLQTEIAHYKSQHETERDQLIDEITRLRMENKNLDENFSKERQIMFTKEQELKKDLLNTRQQFWRISNEVQQEREMLERKMKQLESDTDNHIENLRRELQALQQKLHACTVSKLELEKENLALREGIEKQPMMQNIPQNESHLPGNIHFQKEIQELKDKFQSLAAGFQNQIGPKENNQKEREHEILQMKLTWEQQKLHFQQRMEELESQLRECRSNSLSDKRDFEFKLKQYTNQVTKLKEKVDSQKEKLYSQRELIEKSIPAEVHFQVRNQLTDLQKRLEDYRRLITADPVFPLKQPLTSQTVPEKMLADIKNIDFRAFSEQTVYSKGTVMPSEVKDAGHSFSKKRTALSRRRSSKTRERNSLTKAVSPVLSSSSDIDLENL